MKVNSDYLCIAVDWGTTNLRAYLLDQQGQISAQRESEQGILHVAAGEYESVLTAFVGDWMKEDIPVLMAGMVGSRTGWQEIPYQHCPFQLEQLAQSLTWLTTDLPCPVAIVPGLDGRGMSGCNDVMRGEETQLLGLWDWLQEHGVEENPLCCLPGTHCKWTRMEQGKIAQFSTTFTGELFSHINRDSSLVRGLPQAKELNLEAFKLGLTTSQKPGGLLHHLFSGRSNFISGELAAEQVRDYLSAIIIGHDVHEMLSLLSSTNLQETVYLVGNRHLCQRYGLALEMMGVNYQFIDAAEATVRGLKRMAALVKNA